MVDPLVQQLLAGFLDEAEEIAARVTRCLLELERPGGGRSFDDLARGLHTLKGSAATLGLGGLADLAHRMEDAVLPLRGRGAPLPAPITDALLQTMDAFLAHLRALARLGGDPVDLAPLATLLQEAARGAAAETALQPELITALQPGHGTPLPPFRPEPPPSDPPPPAEEPEPGGGREDGSWRVSGRQVVGLLQEVERLRELRLRLDERRRELDHGLQLLARLGLLAETAEARAQLMGSARALGGDGEEAADIVASLEEGLKAITTLPVRTALEPLRRAVRDLCKAQGKQARLSVVGAEVSLDRRVLDALRAPLVHLVRNAVDHGLETPAVREARGKHCEGALTIRVERQGNMLFFEIADDGGGLDLARIRDAAVRTGAASAEEVAGFAPAQLQQLIFRPGFSTREIVTETSGRGVGLDVVHEQIRLLHGHVEVQSVAGQGTRFLLTIPADLGSSPVLVVRCGEHVLGVPMAAIESSRASRSADLRIGRSKVQLEHREQLIPLQDLGALLGLRQPEVPHDGQPLLVLQLHGHRVALAVDEVIGDKELFIRPLPHEVRELPAYQGAATLARGELALIVRPDWLVAPERKGDTSVAGTRRALVVDDSLTARALHRTALESGGYQVHTASNGRQALEQLRHSAYDVLVCDIGMEEMDGYDLTRAVRARHETDSMPVILVSARDSDSDRERGLSVGADGFLSKKDCVSGRLLSEVATVIARRKGARA